MSLAMVMLDGLIAGIDMGSEIPVQKSELVGLKTVLAMELGNRRASPASAPEGVVEWMQNIDSAMKEPIFQEARALMGTENYGQDVSLLQALRLVRRRMLAAAPTPPVSEDQKDSEKASK